MSNVKTLRGTVPRKTQRYLCLDCGKSFTNSKPGSRKRVSNKLKTIAINDYIHTKSSLSEIGKRHNIHPSSINRWIMDKVGTESLPSYGIVSNAKTSGYICIDAKVIKVVGEERVFFLVTDAKTNEFLCYLYARRENKEATLQLLSLSKRMFSDNDICGITSDFGKGKCFVGCIKDMFPSARHQICLVHFFRYFDSYILKSRKSRYFWRNGIFERTVKAIVKAETKEEGYALFSRLLSLKAFFPSSYHKRFLKTLEKHFDLFLAYREDPQLPSTSNSVEAKNRSLKRKLQNMDGFKSDESAKAFLKLWFEAQTMVNS